MVRSHSRFVLGGCLCALVFSGGCLSDEGRQQNFDGPWVRHTIDDTLRGADGVRVADVNGDGLPDVTTGWEEAGLTRAYLHPGFDDVTDRWPEVTVGETPHVEDAVWADVNGDGNMDVVSSLEGSARAVFVSFAPADPEDFLDPAAWTTEEIPAARGRRWMYALPMDVDGRGGIDLVVGGKGKGAMLGWLESPEDPSDLSAWTLHKIATVGWVMSIESVDMNEDGVLDILISDRAEFTANGVSWFDHSNGPDAVFDEWTRHPVGARHRSPGFIGPVYDNEARLEAIVVPSGGERLTLFERESGRGDLWSSRPIPYPGRLGSPKSVAIGDIDLDGTNDVVVACTNLSGWEDGMVWFAQATGPTDVPPEKQDLSGAQGEKFDRIELLDLDGDGDLDVLTTEEVQRFGVIWYENPLLSPVDDDTEDDDTEDDDAEDDDAEQ